MAGPYYVNGSTGNDANDGLTEGTAWKTIQKGLNTAINNEIVYVKDTGTYVETLTPANTASTWVYPIWYEGYSVTPGDGGKVTVDSGGVNTFVYGGGTGYKHLWFKNFIFRGGSSTCVYLLHYGHSIVWQNCEFLNSGGYGIDSGIYNLFIDCIFANNASGGFKGDGKSKFICCEFYGNTGNTITDIPVYTVYGCLFYENTLSVAATNVYNMFCNNTVDGEDSTTTYGACYTSTSSTYFGGMFIIANNIFHDIPRAAYIGGGERDATMIGNMFSSGPGSTTDPMWRWTGATGGGLYYDWPSYIEDRPHLSVYGDNGQSGNVDVRDLDPKFLDESINDYQLDEDAPSPGLATGTSLSEMT